MYMAERVKAVKYVSQKLNILHRTIEALIFVLPVKRANLFFQS